MQEAVMVPALWLPIVLSAVIVFLGSSIVWMVFKYENADWKVVPNEDQFLDALRKANIPAPGQYVFPHMPTRRRRCRRWSRAPAASCCSGGR
jgi:hypothetical protein